MDADERKAFIDAYCGYVCHYDETVVAAFLDDHYSAKTVFEVDMAANNHECYSSVMDALGVWGGAMDFAKLQVKLMNPETFVVGE
jgi:hypothetical protein